jgi:Protein of unknown function (DUF1236)
VLLSFELEGLPLSRPILFEQIFAAKLFIAHSQNKPGGTADIAEHHASPFVVGVGNANTPRRYSMTNRFMISVAAAALIAGTGFANAQGAGPGRDAPSAGSTVQQSAPSSEHAAPSAAPANRDAAEPTKPSSGMKATQSDEKAVQPSGAKNQRAPDDLKTGPKGEKSAQDSNLKGEKSKSMSSENDTNAKGGNKDMKAEGRNGNLNAETKGPADSKSQTTTQSQTGATSQSQTTGQAGASAKLSTEQRTRITTVIRSQHVQPAANVNFSISVGTRVPRTMSFHPLPTEVVTIYPEWRGYEFILVGDQIVVIDPRTLEIVAVLEA